MNATGAAASYLGQVVLNNSSNQLFMDGLTTFALVCFDRHWIQ